MHFLFWIVINLRHADNGLEHLAQWSRCSYKTNQRCCVELRTIQDKCLKMIFCCSLSCCAITYLSFKQTVNRANNKWLSLTWFDTRQRQWNYCLHTQVQKVFQAHTMKYLVRFSEKKRTCEHSFKFSVKSAWTLLSYCIYKPSWHWV